VNGPDSSIITGQATQKYLLHKRRSPKLPAKCHKPLSFLFSGGRVTPQHRQSSERGLLSINASGEVPLILVRMYLDAIESAYNGLVLLDDETNHFLEIAGIENAYARGRALNKAVFGVSFSPNGLGLRRVRLESPGAWDLLGKLNPLETIREFLNDRHRRKIENAKLPYEMAALELDNRLRELEIVQRQIEIAKSAGISERRLKSMMRTLIDRPFKQLAAAEQNGIIADAHLHREGEGSRSR
jgi:hypothetical protein